MKLFNSMLKLTYMESMYKSPKNITIFIVSVSIIITLVVFAIYKKPQTSPAVDYTKVESKQEQAERIASFAKLPIPSPSEEAIMQKQIAVIFKNEKESECESLPDPRYKFSCHDFFKVKRESLK